MTIGRMLLYAVSLALAALCVTWALGFPPPLWIPPLVLAGYLLLVFWGVMSPRLQMFGPALCSVPQAAGKVALTFDDGPDPSSTPLVLDQLKEAGAQATFFMVGQKVEKYPEIAIRVVREGHELGAHSYDHNRLYAFLSAAEVERDIARTSRIIEKAAGVVPHWFRPPVGQMSPRTALGVLRSGMRVAGWSVRSLDGLPETSAERVRARVLPKLQSGAIVLLHDAPEKEHQGSKPPAGVAALPDILATCRERGLQCVCLGDLEPPGP